MRLLKQPNSNCLLYAAAMVLDVEPLMLIDEIGHGGQEVWWERLPYPKCLKGIHIEEIIDCFTRRGYGLTPIHHMPVSSPFDDGSEARCIWTAEYCRARQEQYYSLYDGIIVTEIHAAAWNHTEKLVYDPNGFRKSLQSYSVVEFWMQI